MYQVLDSTQLNPRFTFAWGGSPQPHLCFMKISNPFCAGHVTSQQHWVVVLPDQLRHLWTLLTLS
jgi:hypothetical protein